MNAVHIKSLARYQKTKGLSITLKVKLATSGLISYNMQLND
jgi:hypothetical protein